MKLYQILLIILSFFFVTVSAQRDRDTITFISDTSQIIIEKIYLHTDRHFYNAGEDIWFKSYLVDALLNQLTNHSEVVYVELISSDSLVLQSNTVRLYNGTGSGDFHIPDTILPGHYFLRAYTKYMRNFSNDFFYIKELDIENFRFSSDKSLTKKDVYSSVDIQFFPEGGSLVQEVYSRVAFKAVNSNGYGCNVSGFVISSEGDTVTNFHTEHLGMGSFYFKPEKHLSYFALVKEDNNGLEFRTELPLIYRTGIVMRINVKNKSLYLTISTNNESLSSVSSPLILKGTFRNHTFFNTTLTSKKITHYTFPTENFPEGIVKLSICGSDSLPLCERLVFIGIKDQPNITISSGKQIYSPREPTILEVSISTPEQIPIYANLSMAIVDQNAVKVFEPYVSNIASWFLLESEIKGNIEQPGYYFDNSQPNRQKHLDLLLLTQGWRDFRWKYISLPFPKMSYLPERGLTISGNLRNTLVNKPIANANISLGIFDEQNPFFGYTQTDSVGRFVFDKLYFTGQTRMIISATNEKNRKRGWLLLDSLVSMPPEVSIPEFPKEELMPEVDDIREQDAYYKYMIKKRYSLKDTIPINEVVVKEKKPTTNKNDGHFRLYNEPDAVVEVTDIDHAYSNIFDLLKGRVAGLSISGTYPNITVSIRGCRSLHGSCTPLFLLDGFQVDMGVINNIPPSFVDKVEVLKNIGNTAIYGSRGANGVICVFTKKRYEPIEKEVFHSINKEIAGYTNSRIFYSPKYDLPKPDHEKPDLRSTIHWEPYINISNSEPVSVRYYNADLSTKIVVDIQGITESGIPVIGKFEYEIK